MTLTIGSLFSGIGGLELGLEMAGHGPVLYCVERHYDASHVPTLVAAEYRIWIVGFRDSFLVCAAHAIEKDDLGCVAIAVRLMGNAK